MREPSQEDITYAVQRNFGGYFGDFKPAEVFLSAVYPDVNTRLFKPARELVMEAVRQEGRETRYILLLTKNNAALTIIQEQVGGGSLKRQCHENIVLTETVGV